MTDKLEWLDREPTTEAILDTVLAGLARTPKTLPSKLFYDERGSRLFDRICELEEYYPTRTEHGILEQHLDEMLAEFGPRCRLVELGSGSSTKTRLLLDRARDLVAYTPIDISRDHLLRTAEQLAEAYPRLPIQPVCADYTRRVEGLPPAAEGVRTVVFFPGSTVGNFVPAEAAAFLARVRGLCGAGGGLLVGVDLVKEAGVLHRAYNDAEGVTAAFNLNLLVRLRDELGADIEVDAFRHRAIWDLGARRIEMQLVSRREQSVRIDDREFSFGDGEAITTEYSHKYTLSDFADLAARAGFEVERVWTDERQWFSVQWCRVVDQ